MSDNDLRALFSLILWTVLYNVLDIVVQILNLFSFDAYGIRCSTDSRTLFTTYGYDSSESAIKWGHAKLSTNQVAHIL